MIQPILVKVGHASISPITSKSTSRITRTMGCPWWQKSEDMWAYFWAYRSTKWVWFSRNFSITFENEGLNWISSPHAKSHCKSRHGLKHSGHCSTLIFLAFPLHVLVILAFVWQETETLKVCNNQVCTHSFFFPLNWFSSPPFFQICIVAIANSEVAVFIVHCIWSIRKNF